jgi:hypothetical protein
MNQPMSPIFKSVLNALMPKSDEPLREDLFDERDQNKLQSILAEKSITLSRLGQTMNFYPGNKASGCHEIAFFVSLKDQPNRARLKLRKYLTFAETLKTVVCHCQGTCRHTTRHIGIITDSIDNEALSFWRSNLREIINDTIEVEFYLVIAGQTIRIDITKP